MEEDVVAGCDGDAVTNPRVRAEELALFEFVGRFIAESAVKRPIAYKDTTSYFGINLGRVGQWFIRPYFNGPKKAFVLQVPVEQAQRLARCF
ncbi:MAG: hypothetical protein U0324_45725 [Polyangiales bacterium]